MSNEEPKRVVHEDDLEWYETDRGSFGQRRRLLSLATGGRKLGCSLYELPPGRRSAPYHWHAANEEAIYVLEGEGMLRLAGRETPLRRGCYAALPSGQRYTEFTETSAGDTICGGSGPT